MHVSLTRASTDDKPPEQATIVAEQMHGWLREIDGFEGFVVMSRPGTTIGLSFWESREIAESHRAVRVQFIERMANVVGVTIEEITDFDVTFAELGPAIDRLSR
jgi:hypothetical protein